MKRSLLIVLVACLPLIFFAQSIETALPNTDGDVYALVRNGNDLYIAGAFTNVGGMGRNYLAKINATTGAVQSWNPDVNSFVNCMTLSADGSTLFVGGAFTMVGATSRNYLAAINTTTGAAMAWNPNPDFFINYLACTSDNTVFVVGDYTSIHNADGSTVARMGMSAVNAAGNITNFNPRPSNVNQIRDLAVSSDNNFLFVGIGNGAINFTDDMSNVVNRQAFAALNVSDGTPTTWDAHPNTGVFDVEVSGTTLYMAGSFETVNNGADSRSHLAKWNNVNTSPSLDATFNPPTMSNVRAIALNGAALYCVGSSYKIGTTLQSHFYAVSSTTAALQSDFNLGANNFSDGTRTKLFGSFSDNRAYLFGYSSSEYSLLGVAKRYFHSINLANTAIVAKAHVEVPNAVGTVTHTLNSPQNTAMLVEIEDPSSFSTAYIFADRYTSSAQNVSGVAEANVLPYRFFFHKINVNGTTLKLKFKLSDIPNNGISMPANTKIYYRNTPAEGSFTSAGTVTYDAGAGTLSVDANAWFGVNEIIFATNDAVVLPVELLSFKGQYISPFGGQGAGSNLLTWTTAEEKNTRDFDIERSNNGQLFQKIGTVKAKGSNSSYEFTDLTHPLGVGGLYYRLKINDLDGKTDYSKTIALSNAQKTQVKIYPSVTIGDLTVEGAAAFEIINVAGQVVYQEKGSGNFKNFPNLNLSHLPNGMYIIKGQNTEGGIFSQKIVKQ